MEKVGMVGLVRRQYCGHLVMIRGVDVFINTVPRQLYLQTSTFVNVVKHARNILTSVEIKKH